MENIHVYRSCGPCDIIIHFVLEEFRYFYDEDENWEYFGTFKNYIACIVKELANKKVVNSNLI